MLVIKVRRIGELWRLKLNNQPHTHTYRIQFKIQFSIRNNITEVYLALFPLLLPRYHNRRRLGSPTRRWLTSELGVMTDRRGQQMLAYPVCPPKQNPYHQKTLRCRRSQNPQEIKAR